MAKKKNRSTKAQRASARLKNLKPAPVADAEAKLVKGGTPAFNSLPPDKQREIAKGM